MIEIKEEIPIQNRIIEPTRLPKVAVTTADQNENCPDATKNPANGNTISDGIGMAALSRSDNTNRPVYPNTVMS